MSLCTVNPGVKNTSVSVCPVTISTQSDYLVIKPAGFTSYQQSFRIEPVTCNENRSGGIWSWLPLSGHIRDNSETWLQKNTSVPTCLLTCCESVAPHNAQGQLRVLYPESVISSDINGHMLTPVLFMSYSNSLPGVLEETQSCPRIRLGPHWLGGRGGEVLTPCGHFCVCSYSAPFQL